MSIFSKDLVKNIFSFVFTMVVLFLIFEVATRVLWKESDRVVLSLPKGAFRYSATNDIWYEHIPNARVVDKHYGLISINSDGLRDKEYGKEKTKDVFRIAVLGDSVTFGQNVVVEDTYSDILEKMLNDKSLNKKWEVLNFGVMGYGTHQELALLRSKVLGYKPDLVLVGYCLNDPEDGHVFVKISKSVIKNILRKHSLFYGFLSERKAILLQEIKERRRKKVGDMFFDQINYVNDIYQGVDWENAKSEIQEMAYLARDSQIDFIIVVLPVPENLEGDYPYKEVHEKVVKFCTSSQIDVLDLYSDFTGKETNRLRASESDRLHYSGEGHLLAAKAILKYLVNKYNIGFDADENKNSI